MAVESATQFAYQSPATMRTCFPVPFHLQNAYLTAGQQQQQYIAAANVGVAATVLPALGSVYPSAYTYPQYLQVQQLFQKDAQTITPEAIATVKAAIVNSAVEQKVETKKKAVPRKAAGQTWEDPTLADWPEKLRFYGHAKEVLGTVLVLKYKGSIDESVFDYDFRLFCGDLGNEVNDDVLTKAFSRFPSFNMARVVRDKRTGKTKGYGFVSFANASDLTAALKEMNGKYVGNRPIKLRKSTWKVRIDYESLEKQKNQVQKKPKASKRSILHK